MRRTQKTVEKLLTELERTGIPLTACSKVGVSRSTYYRWRQENITFKLMTDEAIRVGRENITDLAESKLVKNISAGNQRAIEFQLQTFIEVIFDSIEISLDKRYSDREPDDYTMELLEVAAKKGGAIRYLQKLIEAEAERRLKDIHEHYVPKDSPTE